MNVFQEIASIRESYKRIINEKNLLTQKEIEITNQNTQTQQQIKQVANQLRENEKALVSAELTLLKLSTQHTVANNALIVAKRKADDINEAKKRICTKSDQQITDLVESLGNAHKKVFENEHTLFEQIEKELSELEIELNEMQTSSENCKKQREAIQHIEKESTEITEEVQKVREANEEVEKELLVCEEEANEAEKQAKEKEELLVIVLNNEEKQRKKIKELEEQKAEMEVYINGLKEMGQQCNEKPNETKKRKKK